MLVGFLFVALMFGGIFWFAKTVFNAIFGKDAHIVVIMISALIGGAYFIGYASHDLFGWNQWVTFGGVIAFLAYNLLCVATNKPVPPRSNRPRLFQSQSGLRKTVVARRPAR